MNSPSPTPSPPPPHDTLRPEHDTEPPSSGFDSVAPSSRRLEPMDDTGEEETTGTFDMETLVNHREAALTEAAQKAREGIQCVPPPPVETETGEDDEIPVEWED